MSVTVARPRRPLVGLRLLAFALVAVVAAAAIAGHSRDQPPRGCDAPAECVASLDGNDTLVSTSVSGRPDASLEPAADGSVSLVGLDGTRHWRVTTGSEAPPRLVAAGDLSTDGVSDYVLSLTRPRADARRCGSTAVAETSLLVVDGRTGRASSPFRALRDVCWERPAFTYATHQWSSGTVYIGDFTGTYRGPEVVVVPYYANSGQVWNVAQSGRWQLVRTPSADDFPFPSTAEFDRAYGASNPTPCASPMPGGPCHIPDSHVANAVFPPGAEPSGLFVLTSSRAVVYRPDLTPTSDVVWWPGGIPGNGGRNYGLVETYQSGGGTYVDLVGGCSTVNRWRAMARSADPTGGDANCGMVRHFERFRLAGAQVADHQSIYHGYVGTHGGLEGRVEFPARPNAALGGPATNWATYNLLRSGTWSAQIYPGPMSTEPMQLPGWYVWDTVELPGGGAALLASPVAAGNMVPAWELDVLRWNGSSFVSIQHASGVVPALLAHASTPTRHTSESRLVGAYIHSPGPGAGRDLLVVDSAGRRRFVSLAEADAAAG
jgi:hypothetical protein